MPPFSRSLAAIVLPILLALAPHLLRAQPLYQLDTDNLRLIYTSPLQSYLLPQVARAYWNATQFESALFDYQLEEPVTVLLHDLYHYGNAGARALPRNQISVGIAPFSNIYETTPSNERTTSWMNHEMVHIVTTDKATSGDRFFRSILFGKVPPTAENPISMLYSFLTTPRWYSPRWVMEGIAVYLQTWMAGGLGRALGGYDEMVFRAIVADSARIYDVVGLESEGTTIDFQVGANSYLYGTRFLSYLALQYGSDSVVRWLNRTEGSRRYFSSQFRQVYGISLRQGWSDWITWEREWQTRNLEAIRRNPVTAFQPLSESALGSVSKAFFDPDGRRLLVATRYPGRTAQIASIDIGTGRITQIADLIGAGGYYVTSPAYDRESQTLFYTTNNASWRNLVALDLKTGKERRLLKNFRSGDLEFNPGDRSLWGVRHFNGISTIVRIPEPYTEWNQILSLPYGRDVFDLDISPDGTTMVAAMMEVGGEQRLISYKLDDLLDGRSDHTLLFDFGLSPPSNFVFSPDGRTLYGSSYYSGVSNIFRYTMESGEMEPLSNAETGFFRPTPLPGDSVLVFRYSGRGFIPGFIPDQVPETVSAIRFLGNEIARNQPDVRSWLLPPPPRINADSLEALARPTGSLRLLRLDAAYPIIEGYQDAAAFGVHVGLSDGIGFSSVDLSASVSPETSDVDSDERFHLGARLRHMDWEVTASYNTADFYDLFGPTKTSRKGYSAGVQKTGILLYDEPRRLNYSVRLVGYGGLETLPDYQNVLTTFDKLLSLRAGLDYSFLDKSLGSVEDELGVAWNVMGRANLVNGRVHPRLLVSAERGFLLPLRHSSVWLRAAAGTAITNDRSNPFANFYFGGFGNNWIDHREVKRFREPESLPGFEINEIGGNNFVRVQTEWVAPPLRFRAVGVPSFYLRWASLSVFSTALMTNVDGRDPSGRPHLDEGKALRQAAVTLGTQLDFRLVTLSHMNSTLSLGYASGLRRRGPDRNALMISFKIM